MEPRETSFDATIVPQFMRLSLVSVLAGAIGFAGMVAMSALHLPDALQVVLFFLLGTPLTLVQLYPGKLHVGPDGLLLTGLGTKRFIDVRNMAGIELTDIGIRVHLHRGKPVDIATRMGRALVPRSIGISPADTALLVRRIDALLIGHDARSASSQLRPRLARGSRTVAEWMADLRAIGQRLSMRVADIDTDDLHMVVEGAQVDPDVRVAAAVVLSARSDEDRARVRVAARALGEPRLRERIEWAAETDDSAITEALEAA
jgi:hypothetical protein